MGTGVMPQTTVSHAWDISPAQALAIQRELAVRVERNDQFDKPRYVAGVDVGFEDAGRTARAAAVVLEFPSLQPVAQELSRCPALFPYVPGLLSFREVPAILKALNRLPVAPDVILCDGHGIAHPRRFGLASHLGVLLERPTLGVAKTRLAGFCKRTPRQRGDFVALTDGDETIGAVLCTRSGCKPVYVSTGHRVALPSAIDLVLACAPRYRLPETTRLADRLASARG